MRKKEEKEAIEMRKRLEEEREAKRQEQRLNFLIKQTELYSHFMQNKLSSQPSEDLPVGDENQDDQDVSPSSSDIETIEEEDSEEAELKKEALKAAQDAVSKQKKLTSAFDDECLRLREAAEPEAPQDLAGANNIDLHNPSVTWSFIVVNIVFLLDCTRKLEASFFSRADEVSVSNCSSTMPVTSTVQTPELFKGSLKEYQLKGLQWLVNCYEQVDSLHPNGYTWTHAHIQRNSLGYFFF